MWFFNLQIFMQHYPNIDEFQEVVGNLYGWWSSIKILTSLFQLTPLCILAYFCAFNPYMMAITDWIKSAVVRLLIKCHQFWMFDSNFAWSIPSLAAWQHIWPSWMWDNVIGHNWATMDAPPSTSWENTEKDGQDRKKEWDKKWRLLRVLLSIILSHDEYIEQ